MLTHSASDNNKAHFTRLNSLNIYKSEKCLENKMNRKMKHVLQAQYTFPVNLSVLKIINRRELTCQNYYAMHTFLNLFHYRYHYPQVKIQQPAPTLVQDLNLPNRVIKHTVIKIIFLCLVHH